MNPITAQDITVLLAAIGAFLVVLGGGAKWVLLYIDKKSVESEIRESSARASMLAHLESEIAALKITVALLTSRETLYLKRVLQLEAYIQGKEGWDMPQLDGWPPR